MILVSPVGSLGSQTLYLVLSSHRGLQGENAYTIMLHAIWFFAVRELLAQRLGNEARWKHEGFYIPLRRIYHLERRNRWFC